MNLLSTDSFSYTLIRLTNSKTRQEIAENEEKEPTGWLTLSSVTLRIRNTLGHILQKYDVHVSKPFSCEPYLLLQICNL